MLVKTKICGLKDRAAQEAALDGGAAYVGYVFYPPSPRAVDVAQAAALGAMVEGRAKRVGLFVDADDDAIARVLDAAPLDLLQLHGHESVDRVAAVKARFGLPAIKAAPVATAADVTAANAWRDVADILLFDAKPPRRPDALPGGNALAFDWGLLAAAPPRGAWMLSGGLDPNNVAAAIRACRPPAVDVSSGVERARGEKDPARIKAFLAAVSAVGAGVDLGD